MNEDTYEKKRCTLKGWTYALSSVGKGSTRKGGWIMLQLKLKYLKFFSFKKKKLSQVWDLECGSSWVRNINSTSHGKFVFAVNI